jgi:PAS domain S-box-containing protein
MSLSNAAKSASFDEHLFRMVIEHSLDALALIQPDGRVSYVSPAISRVLGYTVEEFSKLSPFQIVHPDEQETARHRFNELVAQPAGSQTVTNRVQHKDGSWRWIETISTNQLNTPGTLAIVANFRDISDSRRAAELIRAAEEKCHLIIESATEFAIFTTDLNGRVDSWNSGASRLLGYSEEEIIGQDCRIFFTREDNAQSGPEAEMRDAISQGKGDDQKWHIRKDHSRFWGSGLMMPLRDDSGGVRGYLKIFRDMTREKLAEEQLKEADRRKDEFIATLAHELRNPLAAISNAALLLNMPGDERSLEWSQEVIERQTKHLSRLLDDLLDISRINQGKIQLRQENLKISSAISKAIEVVRPGIEKKKLNLTVEISSGELAVFGDSTRIEQILVNLLGNAIKYTGEGGAITVTAKNGNEVVITIEDTGVGIEPEMLPRVFDLFAQVDRSLDRTQGGLGIGLTLVRTLVEMHGGKVTATSAGLGKGSTFRVSLPLAADPGSVEHSLPRELKKVPKKGFRVLVVDDNRDLASSLGTLLSYTGYDVLTAFDGRSALDLANSSTPNALILDIGLPGIDGYHIAKRLRASSQCRGVLLIAMSGYGQEEDRKRSHEAGFDHHLVKPVEFNTLSAILSAQIPNPGGESEN